MVVRSCPPVPIVQTCPPTIPPTTICGDHYCKSGVEDCSNCPQDCGVCPSDQCIETGCCIGAACHNLTPQGCATMGGTVQPGLCQPNAVCFASQAPLDLGHI